jgi:hypothetical protein
VRHLGDAASSLRADSLCSKVSAVNYVPTTDLRGLREETIRRLRQMMLPAHWQSQPLGVGSPVSVSANGARTASPVKAQANGSVCTAQSAAARQTDSEKQMRSLMDAHKPTGIASPEAVAAGPGGGIIRLESSDSGGVEGVMTTNTSPRHSPRNIGLGPVMYGAGNDDHAKTPSNTRPSQALVNGGAHAQTPLSRPPRPPATVANVSPGGGAGTGRGKMDAPEKRTPTMPKLPLAALNQSPSDTGNGSGGVGMGYTAVSTDQTPWRIVSGGGGDGRRSPGAQMYKAMTPRTEIRRHMQGKSTATSVKRPQASPSLFGSHRSSPRTDDWAQVSPSALGARGDVSASRTQRSSSPIPGDVTQHNSAQKAGSSDMKARMDPSVTPAGNGKPSPSVLGTGQRGTWVASSAGGTRMKFDDKKIGFLTGVETGVTAMRGAAGW